MDIIIDQHDAAGALSKLREGESVRITKRPSLIDWDVDIDFVLLIEGYPNLDPGVPYAEVEL